MKGVGYTASRGVAAVCACLLAGCVFVPLDELPLPPAVPQPEPEPPAAELEGSASAVAVAPPVEPEPAAQPAPPGRALVLLPAQADSFASVLAVLEPALSARGVATRRATLDRRDALSIDADRDPPAFVIAVGSTATRAALDEIGVPVVFCQVPDLEAGSLRNAFGVAALPPLELQLEAWRKVDPSLQTVGLVLGRDEYRLAEQARRAADLHGLALELQLASSDQEALYHFRRMAPDIDGLWLLPDNTVLSPRAIREMLAHAGSRGVQTLVFTPALLEWGALLSVAPTQSDLAAALLHIIEGLLDGDAAALPPLTPLSELEARVNLHAAADLGVSPPAEAWIERSAPR